MNIFVTKNGIRLGPYTIADAQNERALGHLVDSDWAWYEGIADWIPLSQVPGMATPVIPTGIPQPPQFGAAPSDPGLLWRRLATAFVLFIIGFVFFFAVIFIVVMMIGGAISGAEASTAAHAQGYEEGSRLGREAGQKFGEAYSGIVALIDLFASLGLSAVVSLWVAFSGLFPWCKPRNRTP